jgi:hypothetical protein
MLYKGSQSMHQFAREDTTAKESQGYGVPNISFLGKQTPIQHHL